MQPTGRPACKEALKFEACTVRGMVPSSCAHTFLFELSATVNLDLGREQKTDKTCPIMVSEQFEAFRLNGHSLPTQTTSAMQSFASRQKVPVGTAFCRRCTALSAPTCTLESGSGGAPATANTRARTPTALNCQGPGRNQRQQFCRASDRDAGRVASMYLVALSKL